MFTQPLAQRPVKALVAVIAGLTLVVGSSPAATARGTDARRSVGTTTAHGHPYSLENRGLRAAHGGTSAAPAAPRAGRRDNGNRTVLVWSQRSADGSGIHLMIAHGDGGEARALTAPVDGVYDLDPQISPDNRTVLFERDTDDAIQVVTIGIDGHGEHVVPLGCQDPCIGDVTPTWGPDGASVWFTRVLGPFDDDDTAASAVLWTADLGGANVHQVSPEGVAGTYEEYSAKFLPNGDRVFLRLRNADLTNILVRVGRDGREHALTDWAISADIFDPSPAKTGPTAGLVVFETYGHGAPEGIAQAVATVPSGCATPAACMARVKYLTPTLLDPDAPAENYNPVWSPDGTHVAYVHAYDGTDADPGYGADIWAMTWKGTHKTQLSDAPEWDFRPDWAYLPRHS